MAREGPMRSTVGLLCLMVLLPSGAGPRDDWAVREPMRLGCESGDVHLYRVRTIVGWPMEAFQQLWIYAGVKKEILRGLDQLEHRVQVADAEHALRFVRLRTAPPTWYLWPGTHIEAEVVRRGDERSLPSYGLRPAICPACLTPKICREVGFGPARVARAPGGFAITRWIYSEDLRGGCVASL